MKDRLSVRLVNNMSEEISKWDERRLEIDPLYIDHKNLLKLQSET